MRHERGGIPVRTRLPNAQDNSSLTPFFLSFLRLVFTHILYQFRAGQAKLTSYGHSLAEAY
jgi:hypothetical protein